MRLVLSAALLLGLAACASDVDTAGTTPAAEAPDAPAAEPAAPIPAPTAGTAHVTLAVEGVALDGEYPANLCGGPYIMGEGVSYQTRADGWQITLSSESRTAGTFALRDDAANYGLIVNGPDDQYLARAGGAQVLTVSNDFRTAEVNDAELRHVVGAQTARVSVHFDCP